MDFNSSLSHSFVLSHLSSLLLSFSAGFSASDAAASGSVTENHLLLPWSCSTPTASIIMIITITIYLVFSPIIINISFIISLIIIMPLYVVPVMCYALSPPSCPLLVLFVFRSLSFSLNPVSQCRWPPAMNRYLFNVSTFQCDFFLYFELKNSFFFSWVHISTPLNVIPLKFVWGQQGTRWKAKGTVRCRYLVFEQWQNFHNFGSVFYDDGFETNESRCDWRVNFQL